MAQFYHLTYDIPSDSGIPNPRWWLIRKGHAFPNLSVCVGKVGNEPWSWISSVRRQGAIVTMHKYDATETEGLLAEISEAIQAQLQQEADQAAALTDKRADEWSTSEDENRNKVLRNKAKLIFTKYSSHIEALQLSARSFGLDANAGKFATAAGVVAALQASLDAKSKVVAGLVDAVAKLPGLTDLAVAAQHDDVPPEILADAAEENGLDVSAMRELFSPAPAMVTQESEDGGIPEEDLELEDATL